MATAVLWPTDTSANARLEVSAYLSRRLLAAGQIVLGLPPLEQAAAREGSALRDVRLAIEQLCEGQACPRGSGETTFAAFAERVLPGKLAEQCSDHVNRPKRQHVERTRQGPAAKKRGLS
ncbi:hypothetical protein [Sorangium sp. So ce854]|uniref:hypothetical protein n=1 Tax=Sorangium sp. So ce854 TaxID=3133322 RepID=UPI003F6050BC